MAWPILPYCTSNHSHIRESVPEKAFSRFWTKYFVKSCQYRTKQVILTIITVLLGQKRPKFLKILP